MYRFMFANENFYKTCHVLFCWIISVYCFNASLIASINKEKQDNLCPYLFNIWRKEQISRTFFCNVRK